MDSLRAARNSHHPPAGGACSKIERLCAELVRTRLPSQAIGLAVRVGGKESEHINIFL